MKRKPKTITRAEARRRAGEFLIRSLLRGAAIKDGAKYPRTLGYRTKRFQQENVWLLFLQQKDQHILRSSEVVAICKRTGRVLYHGSDDDEG